MAEKIILTDSIEQTAKLFGELDANLDRLERAFGVTIKSRDTTNAGGNAISVSGENLDSVEKAVNAIGYLKRLTRLNDTLTAQNVDYAIDMISDGRREELSELDDDAICLTTRGKPIKAKTIGQKKYVELIKKNTVVMGIGPAGTGKTFLAVAMAVTALRSKQVERIILTRPAVEAGEKLGFLPGDLQNKIDPYLRPLYDALYEMLGVEAYQRYVERGTIEIAPLAYMRGRTLDDSFIILDEAQNTTPEQMKMFLTRLGFNSKAVVTGDLTQTDLPLGKRSGLAEAVKILEGIDDIGVHRFSERDVVRHRLVQKIILAYENYDKQRNRGGENRYNDSHDGRRFRIKNNGEQEK
ncbi:MAG: phosphate starvation-inducible protein PhoH [Clostridiales bacterium]|nr:phosphate starvation-inducible protein PhoH [Clostridiales bacterium]